MKDLTVKGQQGAAKLLSKDNEFSVVAGAAMGMGQLQRLSTVHRNRLGEEEPIGFGQIGESIVQLKLADP